MTALFFVLVSGVFSSPPPPPAPLDIAAVRENLRAFTDGKGHVVCVLTDRNHPQRLVFYGDGKTLYAQRVTFFAANQDDLGGPWRMSWKFQDPRISGERGPYGHVRRSGDRWTVVCADRTTRLIPMGGQAENRLLRAATFRHPLGRRWPYLLARDPGGRYYFVDRHHAGLSARPGGDATDLRVWRGAPGRMVRLPVKRAATDSTGGVFTTRRGVLRFLDSGETASATWVAKGRSTKLAVLSIRRNLSLIFDDLGVYFGERLGTPCDDL